MTKELHKIRTARVYVIHGGRACKIGFSANPVKRLSSINTGRSIAAEVVHATDALSLQAASEIERAAHNSLAAARMNGEWFAVSAETARIAVEVSRAVVASADHGERNRAQAALMLLEAVTEWEAICDRAARREHRHLPPGADRRRAGETIMEIALTAYEAAHKALMEALEPLNLKPSEKIWSGRL